MPNRVIEFTTDKRFVRSLNLPETRERLRNLGVDLAAGSPGQFAQHLKSEIAR